MKGHRSSASTFAAGLGLSNIHLESFMPVGCIFPAASFYEKLVFKTISRVVVISLVWTPAHIKHTTDKDWANSGRTSARWSLFLLEFIVPGVPACRPPCSKLIRAASLTALGISPVNLPSRVMTRQSASSIKNTLSAWCSCTPSASSRVLIISPERARGRGSFLLLLGSPG